MKDIYKLQIDKTMHKCQLGKPIGIKTIGMNVDNIHHHKTRYSSAHSLHLPRVRTNMWKHTMEFAGAKVWCIVPGNLKNYSFQKFKPAYKTYLISKYEPPWSCYNLIILNVNWSYSFMALTPTSIWFRYLFDTCLCLY